MKNRIKQLYADEEGATMVEYALMLALIAILLVGAVTFLRERTGASFENAGNSFP